MEEAEGGIYYTCPVTETGLHDVGAYEVVVGAYEVVHRRKPRRTEIWFDCHACEGKHYMIFKERKNEP